MAPTEAGVIYEVGADASGPVTHGVVDWRRGKTVPEQFVRIRRGVVLEDGEDGPATRRTLRPHAGSHLHGVNPLPAHLRHHTTEESEEPLPS